MATQAKIRAGLKHKGHQENRRAKHLSTASSINKHARKEAEKRIHARSLFVLALFRGAGSGMQISQYACSDSRVLHPVRSLRIFPVANMRAFSATVSLLLTRAVKLATIRQCHNRKGVSECWSLEARPR